MYKIDILEINILDAFNNNINTQSYIKKANTNDKNDIHFKEILLSSYDSLSEEDKLSFLFVVYKVYESRLIEHEYNPADLEKVESIKLKVWLTKFLSFVITGAGLIFIGIFFFVLISNKTMPNMSLLTSFLNGFEEVILAIINAGTEK